MSYVVLARKLRPAGFDALVGQDHVVKALSHALDQGRLHHAYLFTGTRGVGKTTIARILAKALNCEQGVSSTPCGECSVCLEVKENRFVDLIEVDAASRTGVDDTRELLENAQYMPTVGRYKVYLIDEVHMLSTASFNALLKTLEEPPEHVKFLLATTDPKKVPPTVLSRCLQFQLKNMSRQTIEDYLGRVLTDESVAYDNGALQVIARCAAGSMRDALSLTDQAIAYGEGALVEAEVADMLGIVGEQDVALILDALGSGDAQRVLSVCADLAEQNADFAELLDRLMDAFHRQAVSLATGVNKSSFSADALQLFYQIALIGARDLELAPEPRSGFEMTMLRMLTFAPERDSSVPPLKGSVDSQSDDAKTTEQAAPQQAVSGSEQPQVDVDVHAENSPAPAATESLNPAMQVHGSVEVADVDWFNVVGALPIAGVSRMICDNAVLVRFDMPDLTLCLDERHETLLNDSQRSQLERALSEHFATEVKLVIELGQPPGETPAQRVTREAQERQSAAEASIQQDPTVAGILSDFGGNVEEIRPV